jgi:hypothetical protein
MGGLVWFDKTVQACQGPTSFIAHERGWVIFEYSHVFRSGGSLMFQFKRDHCKRVQRLEDCTGEYKLIVMNNTSVDQLGTIRFDHEFRSILAHFKITILGNFLLCAEQ